MEGACFLKQIIREGIYGDITVEWTVYGGKEKAVSEVRGEHFMLRTSTVQII